MTVHRCAEHGRPDPHPRAAWTCPVCGDTYVTEHPTWWSRQLVWVRAVDQHGAWVSDHGLTIATLDLLRHIARMLDDWAEMRVTENMSAEEAEVVRERRNRVLWTPLHNKADVVRDALERNRP